MFDVLYCEVDGLSEVFWVGHAIDGGDVLVSAVSVCLDEDGGVVSCLSVADVLVAGVFSAVGGVVEVSSVAHTEAVDVLVFEPAATAAAFIVVFHNLMPQLLYNTQIVVSINQQPYHANFPRQYNAYKNIHLFFRL